MVTFTNVLSIPQASRIREEPLSNGLYKGHAYTITAVAKVNNDHMYMYTNVGNHIYQKHLHVLKTMKKKCLGKLKCCSLKALCAHVL